MRVLGLDPGAWLGWCVLDLDIAPAYVEAGVLSIAEIGEDAARAEIVAIAERLCVMHAGVERVRDPHVRGCHPAAVSSMVVELAASSWLGGELAEALRGLACVVAPVPVEDVRNHALGPLPATHRKRAIVDDLVLAWCAANVVRWPARIPGRGAAYRQDGADLLAQRRSHACDAALVAVYAGHLLEARAHLHLRAGDAAATLEARA